MVPILDGNAEHVAHARKKIGLFGVKTLICAVNKSYKRDFYIRAHTFLNYHLI